MKIIYNPRPRAKHFYTVICFPSLVVFIEKLDITYFYKLLFPLKHDEYTSILINILP